MQFTILSMGKNYSGYLLLACLMAGFVAGLVSLSRLDVNANYIDFIKGKWAKEAEQEFAENFPGFDLARQFWGRLEFALFNEGRRQVVIGRDGWLYTAEEFTAPRDQEKILKDHSDYIQQSVAALQNGGTQVILAVIPSKARSRGHALYPARKSVLIENFKTDIKAADIKMVGPERIDYLKTDTHWTPDGANEMARMIGQFAGQGESEFENRHVGNKSRKGDLTKFVPGIKFTEEKLPLYELDQPKSSNLFGAEEPEVVLIGTSYSADQDFNFENFLKEYLGRDVLNLAEPGRGPFAVMEKYRREKTYKASLIIWEIPERYLTLQEE